MMMSDIRVKCEFTVEGAYVMAAVIFCLAAIMMNSYKLRDKVVSAYITAEADTDSACSEDTWLRNDGDRIAAERADSQLDAVGRLQGKSVEISREKGLKELLTGEKVTAVYNNEKEISIRIRDPESYMRSVSLWEDRK